MIFLIKSFKGNYKESERLSFLKFTNLYRNLKDFYEPIILVLLRLSFSKLYSLPKYFTFSKLSSLFSKRSSLRFINSSKSSERSNNV
jgi:hypothetical protein